MAKKQNKSTPERKSTPKKADQALLNWLAIGLPGVCFGIFLFSQKISRAIEASDWLLTGIILTGFVYFVSLMKPPKPTWWTVLGGAIAVAGTIIFILANRNLPPNDLLWYSGVTILAAGGVLWFIGGLPKDQAMEWLRQGFVALSLALVIRWAIAEPYRIPSSSMEPTLYGDDRIGRGDRVFVNKWIYGIRYPFMNKRIWEGKKPERWDIVVFKSVEKGAEHPTLVKRVVGLPGERVLIHDGKVFINDEALEIPDFLPEGQYYTSNPPYGVPEEILEKVRNNIYDRFKPMLFGVVPQDEFTLIPEDHYLLLGDNSANSRDGRYFGWMPRDNIVGRVSCIWWWPNHWRDFTGFSQTLWWRALVALTGVLVLLRLFAGRSHVIAAPGRKRGLDHVLISFLAYGIRLPFSGIWLTRRGLPRRGDLVLYYPESDELPSGVGLMGRVAALPGEKVAIVEGRIHIDGKALEGPPPLAEETFSTTPPEAKYGRGTGKEFTLTPEGHVFILQNTEDEDEILDSRTLGWQPVEKIYGRAAMVWWPPSRWRRITPDNK